MDFKKFLESGRALLVDTKLRGKLPAKKEKIEPLGSPAGSDNPYDVFVRKAINEKMKSKDVVESIKKFIDIEEAKL